MSTHTLYRGVWPQNVSKLAKYAVRWEGEWKVTVLYDLGNGERYLAVEDGSDELVDRINDVKSTLQNQLGGAFYINEYRHVIVPVTSPRGGADYYFAGRLDGDLTFEFEGKPLTTKPIRRDGTPLARGDRWSGPRPGIPYVLAAGAADVYYESPSLTDDDPPAVRPRVTRKVYLSKVVPDKAAVARAIAPVSAVRGHQGGRFYVNEHGAMFTPVGTGDGNGIDYVYCGQLDLTAWFPEPPVPRESS